MGISLKARGTHFIGHQAELIFGVGVAVCQSLGPHSGLIDLRGQEGGAGQGVGAQGEEVVRGDAV